jgi:hypothetical protein
MERKQPGGVVAVVLAQSVLGDRDAPAKSTAVLATVALNAN